MAAETIKVGVLHSLSGTMAISETTLKDTVLMMIEEQNKKGGLLGKQLEPVVVDPASNWPLFAEKTRELLTQEQVDVIFGCWTSVSRKSALPVLEELNGLMFYPVQYEGEESSNNVFYTGAAPNQQAIPAVDYLMNDLEVERWVLAGTDYVYPRTTNKILESYLIAKGVAPEDIMVNYTPFGHSDWQSIVADVKKFGGAGKKTAVVSTINGDANVPFYKELANHGFLNRINIGSTGLLNRFCPHVEANICRLHWVVSYTLRIFGERLPLLDESIVDIALDRLEVVPSGKVSYQRLGVDTGKLFFTDREGNDRDIFSRNALVG